MNNYRTVLLATGLGRSFLNSLTAAVPSPIIPILIAAFAAYALCWMRFAGRAILVAMVVVPLSFPARASFAIFQFLWTWSDPLVVLVLLGPQDDKLVLTGRLVNLLGSRGGDWDILAASAFILVLVPIIVFFALQKYLVRGLLAGSIK